MATTRRYIARLVPKPRRAGFDSRAAAVKGSTGSRGSGSADGASVCVWAGGKDGRRGSGGGVAVGERGVAGPNSQANGSGISEGDFRASATAVMAAAGAAPPSKAAS